MDTLDQRDLKIISTIADNADLPYATIGKLTKISKDSVKARIQNLLKEKYILSFFPDIDYSKLGYYHFHTFIKFGSIMPEEDKFVDFVKNHPNVVALTKVIGEYDYEIQLLTRNNFELYGILDLIIQMARIAITKVHPLISVRNLEYTMQIHKAQMKERYKLKKQIQHHKPDRTDINILKIFSLNAREKNIDIAAKLRLTPEIVRYRIKKLQAAGIIRNFYARTNKHRFGLYTYILLLSLRDHATKKDEFFFKNSENIYFARASLGDWNLIVSFYCQNNQELINTLATVRQHFDQRLNATSLLILLDRYKFDPVPTGVDLEKTK